ncbi:MAG: polysaccharide deacetylase family protein [Clostridia bacterium]|nr:polysaccharide deacetylase family protein [Clostridia bacterium]
MRYRFLRFPEGKFKAVTFSYDDGVKVDLRLAEIFDKYGMKGTFNINPSHILRGEFEKFTTPDEIREHILGRGHEVAIHGEQHIAPGVSRPVDAIRDALLGREQLEEIFGTIIRGMAYPDSGVRRFHNGNSYENVRGILENVGIVYARTLGADNNTFLLPTDWYNWVPTIHHANKEAMSYVDTFLSQKEENYRTASRHPRLFYVWGHSFEFRNNDNWELIEEICEKLSGKDDTWYATNMEIWEYCHAYDSLIWNAKGDVVYNPTFHKVWFDIDSRPFSVAPGETLKIEIEYN